MMTFYLVLAVVGLAFAIILFPTLSEKAKHNT
jgi:hypothetical protein